jgi:hypothetical protein
LIEVVIIIALIGIYADLRLSGVLFGEPDTVTIINKDSTFIPPIVVNLPPGQTIIKEKPVPANIDTTSILKAYFREVIYNDSLVNDTVKIILREVISENAIKSRELTWKLNLPITTTTEIHNQRKMELYGGVMLGMGQQPSAYPMLSLKNKKNHVFMGYYNPFTKEGGFGYSMPIKIKSSALVNRE